MHHYERGQWDPPQPAFKINWWHALGLFMLGLSTALMVTLVVRMFI